MIEPRGCVVVTTWPEWSRWQVTGHHAGIEIVPGIVVPDTAWRFQYARSSGPGGQNVNKVNTKVCLQIDLEPLEKALGSEAMARLRQIGGRHLSHRHCRITADEHRSQEANRRACLARLRRLIADARTRPRKRRPTRPSRGAVERRLQRKHHRGHIKALRRERDRDD